MAHKVRVQEVLLKALEELNAEELKRFQWHLVQGVLDGKPPMAKVKVEGVSLDETVTQLMQFYDDKVAVNVTMTALRRMNQNQLARQLDQVLISGIFQKRIEGNPGDDLFPTA
ncbi:NACHT, LRR and PYD domains-containing protein 6 [Astyanax mexicanus]|uniref:NACHT, LRR and PYD domains-containing protein 6 n=1 Tax=Astyanax mexicanus TaxID=7994 RepID=UPI0020CB4120|nr:NACHT, LRR and PYD domains-containing protein 6 [Astyanax mexicanus]